MAGRHTGWTHVRVPDGVSREAAAPYLPDARKLLGFVQEQAFAGNLPTHKVRKELPDGAVIIAEQRHAIPRITIIPPPRPELLPVELEADDFVVWARDAEFPDGIDDEFPQQILKPSWRTFFYAADTEGHDEFSGKKGVYSQIFPDGIRHAGNVDWRSPKGERVSWYGPATRYFFDVFHQPSEQYQRKVFMLGKVLLDVDAYIAASDEETPIAERYVMGAALRGFDLYVLQADLPVIATNTDPIPINTLFFGESLPLSPIPLALCRYSLHLDESGPVPHFKVSANSRTVLWTGAIDQAVNPWIFSPDCARAVSYAPHVTNTSVVGTGPSSGGFFAPPGAFDRRLELEIDDDTAALTVEQFGQTGATPAPIATDWTDKGQRVDVYLYRVDRDATIQAPHIQVGASPGVPLNWRTSTGGTFDNNYHKATILHCDARDGLVLLQHETIVALGNVLIENTMIAELYRHGELVASVPSLGGGVLDTGIASALDRFLNPTGDARNGIDLYHRASFYTVAPSWMIYGQCAYVLSTVRGTNFTGLHSLYSFVGPPPAQLYGSWGIGPDPTPNLVADFATVAFSTDRIDFDGRNSWVGCASYRGKTIFSVPAFRSSNDASLHYVTGATLPELTGVESDNARYHPVWLLGKPPAPTT